MGWAGGGCPGTAGGGGIVTPETLAKEPAGVGMATLNELKVSMLKPSSASQNGLEKIPLLALIASLTSSLPKVFLSIRIDRLPSWMMQALSASLQYHWPLQFTPFISTTANSLLQVSPISSLLTPVPLTWMALPSGSVQASTSSWEKMLTTPSEALSVRPPALSTQQ